MKPSKLITGIIFAIIIVVGSMSLLGILGDREQLNTPQAQAFNNSMAKVDHINNITNTLQSNLNSTQEFGELGSLNALIQTSWNTLRLIPTSIGFVNDMMVGIVSATGLGEGGASLIVGLLWSIIIIGVVFAIFSAIFQTEL